MRTLELSRVNLAVVAERIRQTRRELAELRALACMAKKVQREAAGERPARGQREAADATRE